MARRNDHSREELKKIAVLAGKNLILNEGLGGFSARKVAKEIGYTIGTIYNIFGSHENFILHINATTLDDMYHYLSKHRKNNQQPVDIIKNLAAAYLNYARKNYNLWSALFEFNLPQDIPLPDWYAHKIKLLFTMVEESMLPLFDGNSKKSEHAAKVLWSSIHGICQLGLTGKLDTVGAAPVKVLTDSLIDNYILGVNHA